MEKMYGVTLEDAWKSLDRRARKKLANDLRRHLQQLRAIHQPLEIKGQFTSFIHGPVCDATLSIVSARGPFMTAHEFFDYLLLLISDYNPLKQEYMELLGANSQLPLYLTHGDLSPRNIIVDPQSVRITGIIDWTTCAWMPPYWERFKATFTSSRSAARVAFFDVAAGPWPKEVKAIGDATSLDRGFR
jgi:thiamine kinase-like enzyme